jgi:LPXTG-motif cell wall-anchored protein
VIPPAVAPDIVEVVPQVPAPAPQQVPVAAPQQVPGRAAVAPAAAPAGVARPPTAQVRVLPSTGGPDPLPIAAGLVLLAIAGLVIRHKGMSKS